MADTQTPDISGLVEELSDPKSGTAVVDGFCE